MLVTVPVDIPIRAHERGYLSLLFNCGCSALYRALNVKVILFVLTLLCRMERLLGGRPAARVRVCSGS